MEDYNDNVHEIGPNTEEFEPITIESLAKQLAKLETLTVLNQELRRSHSKDPEK